MHCPSCIREAACRLTQNRRRAARNIGKYRQRTAMHQASSTRTQHKPRRQAARQTEAASRPNTAQCNGMHDRPRRQAARRTSSVRRDVVFTQPSPGRAPARARASLDDGECALLAPEPSGSRPERLRTSQLKERHPVRLRMFLCASSKSTPHI